MAEQVVDVPTDSLGPAVDVATAGNAAMECTRQMGCMCADCSMFATVSLKEVQTKQAIDYGPEDDAMDVDEPEAAPAEEEAPAPVEGARPQPLSHPRAARSQPARTDAAPPAEEPAEPAAAAEEPAAAEDDGAPSLALDPATITKKLKVVELRELLSERGLSTQGNKDVLIERLHDWATGGDAESASDEIAEQQAEAVAEVAAEVAAPAAEEGYASASECLRNSSCKCTDCVPAVAEVPVGSAAPLTTGSEMPTEQATGCAAKPQPRQQHFSHSPHALLPARPVEAETFDGSLAERLVHKNWKARQAAAIELKALFDSAEPDAACFAEYSELLPKMLGDSNVSVLDKMVGAVLSYADKAPAAAQAAPAIGKPLIEKCLAANRPAVRNSAESLVLLMVEVDQPQSTAMLTALVAGSAHRLPKIAQPSLACMTKLLSTFGPAVLSAPLIAQALPPIFLNAKDRKVREAAVNLSVELYRWMGDALMPLLEEVRDSQKKGTASNDRPAWLGCESQTMLLSSRTAREVRAASEGRNADAERGTPLPRRRRTGGVLAGSQAEEGGRRSAGGGLVQQGGGAAEGARHEGVHRGDAGGEVEAAQRADRQGHCHRRQVDDTRGGRLRRHHLGAQALVAGQQHEHRGGGRPRAGAARPRPAQGLLDAHAGAAAGVPRQVPRQEPRRAGRRRRRARQHAHALLHHHGDARLAGRSRGVQGARSADQGLRLHGTHVRWHTASYSPAVESRLLTLRCCVQTAS